MAPRKKKDEVTEVTEPEKPESIEIPDKAVLIRMLQKALGVSDRGSYDHYTNTVMKGAYLLKGMEGELVNAVQMLLVSNGYEAAVTGIFDDVTEKAVKEVQKKIGVEATGIADDVVVKHLCVD